MENEKYDPYYRGFPSNVVPARTPFTRSGRRDAGHLFIYVTNKRRRWTLLLDKTQMSDIYEEARQRIPGGISQLWLVEKRYSTHKPRSRSFLGNRERGATFSCHSELPAESSPQTQSEQILVVLKEPIPSDRLQGDIISYHLRETDAILAAEAYTRRYNHRTVVGLLLWDQIWL
jgi:hypothetical protein